MPARLYLIFFLGVLAVAASAEPPAKPSPPPAQAAPVNGDDLYQAGKQLFDQLAPPEIKQQYDFPSKDQFTDFLTGLQPIIDSGTFEDLAAYQSQATVVLAILRNVPEYADYADWLAARLQEIDEAKRISDLGATAPPTVPPGSSGGSEGRQDSAGRSDAGKDGLAAGPRAGLAMTASAIPYYDAWLRRERGRETPANAAELMPRLRRAFAAEGVPPELAWLAEVESSLNPSARSPSGARGLFQLKADTAHDLGLSTFLPDDRADPEKSARAAARYLRALGKKFGSWPLAFAAYNAGEGRVSRALAVHDAHDFAGVAGSLPAETRMYVPEVCAVVAARTGVTPEEIPAPR